MNTNVQQEVRENIIELFDIDKLPPEQQEEMINKIGQQIFEAVLMRVLPDMPESEVAEYEAMLDKNAGADEVMQFFMDKVPNFMGIVAEESQNFKDEAADILAKL